MIRRNWYPPYLLVLPAAVAGLAVMAMVMAPAALAAEPKPWQMNFQPAASPVMQQITDFHNLLLVVEVAIVVLVLAILGFIVLRFNAKANPVPSKTTHHTTLEVIWTAIPILILVAISVPSMKLLFFMDKADNPEMTLKIVSHQWYWSYQYPDQGNFEFDSNMIADDELKPGQVRLLEVDNRVVLPINTTIRLLMTSDDVIHNWAVPAFGIKMDTVPGRINESWVRIDRKGTYYGQCSELCGINHAFMPIAVEAVGKQEFQDWVAKAKKEFAKAPVRRPVEVAAKNPISPAAGRSGATAIAASHGDMN